MIPNEKRCHYLAVTKLSALSRGITSNHSSNFSCLNCLHSFRKKTKLESHKKVCENKEFYCVGMPCKKSYLSLLNTYSLIRDHALIKKMGYLKKSRKNHPQQKQVNIFHVVIQCLRYGYLMV